MKQPWVYMCSPSRSPLPPPSPPAPSRFSQCTRSERLSHVLFLPQGIDKTPLSSSVELITLHTQPKWKMDCLMKHPSFQREGHSLITLRTTKAHLRPNKGVKGLNTPWSLWPTPLLNHGYKASHQITPPTPPFISTLNFCGHKPAGTLFAW